MQGLDRTRPFPAHPGRIRQVIESDVGPWVTISLPLVFLAGLAVESLFALQRPRVPEAILNMVAVVGVFCWTLSRMRQRTMPGRDPILLACTLLFSAGVLGCLLAVPEGFGFETLLKSVGSVLILLALNRLERSRVEASLRTSEEYLESIFESIPDPVFVIGPRGKIIAGNRSAIIAFGDLVLGKSCCDTYLRHKDCVSCTVTQVWETRQPRFEVVRNSDGARLYEVITFPLFGRAGFSGKLIQQIRDISSEAATEDQAHLLVDVVNSVRDPVLTFGLGGQLRHSNRAAEQLLGEHADVSAAGVSLPFTRADERAAYLAAFDRALPWEREVQLSDASGVETTVHMVLAPVRGSDDRLLGQVLVIRDVTQLKNLQTQLIQTEKLGALGQLVSGVAHELNNPLTAVFGFAQLLLSQGLPESARAEVGHIYAHAERCKRIIDGLLKFARSHHAEKTPAQLNEVIQGATELLAYQLRLANVELEMNLSNRLPETMLDSFQVQQVLINLITNAQHAIQDACRPGRIKITSRLGSSTNIIVEVQDNGGGMTEEVLHKIFDPFFSTKGVGKGTGLGLALSYGIVRDHGGILSARSQCGVGTTFRIDLPVVAVARPLTPPRREPVLESIPASRVLVVDDEPVILALLQQILEVDGHEVTGCEDAPSALEAAENGEFDVVLSDFRMPGMGGEEFYRELVLRYPRYHGRVVFITGDTLDSAVAAMAEAEGIRLLNKPFTIESIREILACLVAAHPAQPAAGAAR